MNSTTERKASRYPELDGICEEIMVRPIDGTRLAKVIGALIIQGNPQFKKRTKFVMNSAEAIAVDSPIMLDDECCHQIKRPFVLTVRQAPITTKNKDGSSTTRMFGQGYEVTATLEEMEPFLLPPVDLRTFMGQRYGYNPRIVSNTKLFIKHLKSAK